MNKREKNGITFGFQEKFEYFMATGEIAYKNEAIKESLTDLNQSRLTK